MSATSASFSFENERLEATKELLDEKLYSDIKLKVEDEIFHVHKAILFLNAPYFKTMLTAETSDKYSEEIELKDIDIVGFKVALSYMYSGIAEITEKNVKNVLSVAEYFQMKPLKELCTPILQKEITSRSCLNIFKTACLNKIESLKVAAKACMVTDLEGLQSELNSFSSIEMQSFLSANSSTGSEDEDSIFKVLLSWVKHDMENRQNYAADLLKLINVGLLSTDTLNAALSNPFVSDCSLVAGKMEGILIERLKNAELYLKYLKDT